MRPVLLLAVAVVGLSSEAAPAAPIVGGRDVYTVTNFQSVELFPGTPFNPGPAPVTVLVPASGLLVVDRNAQVGTTITSTVALAQLTGTFPAPLPPIPFTILAGTHDLPAALGVISNVEQNPAAPGFATGHPSSFVAGDFREEAVFKQVLPDGTTIYSDPVNPAVFTARLTGLPYPVGTTFVSPESVNLYVQTGPRFDPTRDPVIGRSFNRSLIVTGQVTPEPASVMLFGLVAGAGFVVRRATLFGLVAGAGFVVRRATLRRS
jgi:hypothetical protein